MLSGPTASGKTNLSIEIAQYYQTEIISADSRQFYKEFQIGVNIPEPDILKKIKHHFIHSHSIFAPLNVYNYSLQANQVLLKLFEHNNVVLVTGGSGLYIKSFYFQIDKFPDIPSELRNQLSDIRKTNYPVLLELLKLYDPEFYEKGEVRNPIRVQRAIEVSMIAGKPYSSSKTNTYKNIPYKILKIAIELSNEELKSNIISRVQRMRINGLTDEAKRLYHYKHLYLLQTIGYKELFDYFSGKYKTEDEAYEKIIVNTWRYAQKQIRWLRKENFHFLKTNNFDVFREYIDNYIANLKC